MNSSKFAFYAFSIWIFFNSLLFTSYAELKTYYVEELCNGWLTDKTLFLNRINSGILTSVLSTLDTGECTIRLKPDPGFSVVLSIYRFQLNPEDELTITDSEQFKVALLDRGDFPDERKSFTSKGPMVIHYSWNSTQNQGSRLKFQFTFTQAYDGPCRFDEFQCRNRKCVSKDFVCDRHNHCGDNSDQEKCGPQPEYPNTERIAVRSNSTAWVITIIVCGVILAIIVIVFIVLAVRSNIRRKKKQQELKNSPLTVTATVPQAPSAPPATEAPPSVFVRFRQSLRGTLRRTKPSESPPSEEPKTDNYEVPSMYPQIPSTPHAPGIENPEFKGDES